MLLIIFYPFVLLSKFARILDYLVFLLIRVWSSAGSCSHILEGHSGAISSVALVNSNGMTIAWQIYTMPVLY